MPEIRLEFHTELAAIRADIARLGAMVCETIPQGTEALLTNDLGEAKIVIEGDDPIDALTLAIEERCYRLLALQQPMASDLRAIVTAIRLTSEIERSGDLMVNVAKAARRLYRTDFDPRLRGLIARMAAEAGRLFQIALDAYVDGDADMGAALDDMDDALRIPRDQEPRPGSRGAAGAGRSLLRTHRRPRRQHRRAGAVHGHRVAPRTHRRRPRRGAPHRRSRSRSGDDPDGDHPRLGQRLGPGRVTA